jgi:superfamily I DNA/RNA helicase
MDALFSIVASLRNPTVQEVEQLIDNLFTPRPGAVNLATIHQCKGREEDVVYLIKPSLLPHPCTQRSATTIETRWQLDQEDNLRYVAITRAKQEFHYFQDNDDEKHSSPPRRRLRRAQ